MIWCQNLYYRRYNIHNKFVQRMQDTRTPKIIKSTSGQNLVPASSHKQGSPTHPQALARWELPPDFNEMAFFCCFQFVCFVQYDISNGQKNQYHWLKTFWFSDFNCQKRGQGKYRAKNDISNIPSFLTFFPISRDVIDFRNRTKTAVNKLKPVEDEIQHFQRCLWTNCRRSNPAHLEKLRVNLPQIARLILPALPTRSGGKHIQIKTFKAFHGNSCL